MIIWVLSRVDMPPRAMRVEESLPCLMLRKLDPAYGISVLCLVVLLFLVMHTGTMFRLSDMISAEYVVETFNTRLLVYVILEPPTRVALLTVALVTFVLHKSVRVERRMRAG